ncbi:hypothetical protein HYW84_00970 [Candidatus Peregrinibacteria bacterium]|nr:hypothetical protein [Candidatus Peregrinibacteria bacterium]
MQHLVLVDGHHLMYRAFYAVPAALKTSKGEQVNAVYGVASMLLSLLKAEEPDSLLFCFDAGEETFRHHEHAGYKEGRAKTPDEFYLQIPRILELIESFQIKHCSDPRYEADDLLCAYSRAGEKAGMRVTIVTGDRDALQLVTANVRVAIPHKGYQAPEYMTPQAMLAKYGVRPGQIPSYKGLSGDSSDNLPGVRGIGPKGAAQLLQQFETLKSIYDHLDQVKPALRAKLETGRESAFFCERMATLICDFPLPVPIDTLRLHEVATAGAEAFFREFEMNSLGKRLQSLCGTEYGREHFVWNEDKIASNSEAPQNQMALF